jgi:TM2 domain-containing membrane protein YozV
MQSVNPAGSMTDWKAMGGDKKIVAGIVAILLGAFGIHKFLLGYTTEGVIMLVITIVSCGILAIVPSVIGIIEGIIYLTKSDEEFVRTYIQGRKGWF